MMQDASMVFAPGESGSKLPHSTAWRFFRTVGIRWPWRRFLTPMKGLKRLNKSRFGERIPPKSRL